jgi:hypothetical protein
MPRLDFFPNTTRFNLTNALGLAQAARLVYQNKKIIKQRLIKQWKLADCRYFDAGDTQAFAAVDDRMIIAAFRGTQSVQDWQTDLDIKFVKTKTGRIHRGVPKSPGLYLERSAKDHSFFSAEQAVTLADGP